MKESISDYEVGIEKLTNAASYGDLPFANLYHNYNYNDGELCSHGDSGIIANDANDWVFSSLDHSDRMAFYINSSIDIADAALNYIGHCEDYDPATNQNLRNKYPFPQYPLKYLCVDKSAVTMVKISLASLMSQLNENFVMAATSPLPGSSTIFESLVLASTSYEGTGLGFIGKSVGDVTTVTLKLGTLDAATGLIAWSGTAALTLLWDGEKVSVLDNTLPPAWNLSAITQLEDGSWFIDVCTASGSTVCTTFEGKNYTGYVADAYGDSDNVNKIFQANNLFGWYIQSIKIDQSHQAGRFLVYSVIETLNSGYSFNNYRMIKTTEDIPDLPALFNEGNLPCAVEWMSDSFTQLWLKVNTSTPDYSAVVIKTSKDSVDTYFANTTSPGLVGCEMGGVTLPVSIMYGSLDTTGAFVMSGSGEVQVTYHNKDTAPVITNLTLPSELVFSTAEKQSDGSWLISLNEVVAP